MKRLPLWKRPYLARRILDIGAGHNPFKGATHVLDFDLTEGHDRGGRRLTVPDSARLILGQAMALPFETASFDYVYAPHVLEHVDAPEAACREIMRVGAAGYIETPSPFLEQGLAVAAKQPPEYWAHKWFVWSGVPNQLVFEPKTGGGTHRFCSCADGLFMQNSMPPSILRRRSTASVAARKRSCFIGSPDFRYRSGSRPSIARRMIGPAASRA